MAKIKMISCPQSIMTSKKAKEIVNQALNKTHILELIHIDPRNWKRDKLLKRPATIDDLAADIDIIRKAHMEGDRRAWFIMGESEKRLWKIMDRLYRAAGVRAERAIMEGGWNTGPCTTGGIKWQLAAQCIQNKLVSVEEAAANCFPPGDAERYYSDYHNLKKVSPSSKHVSATLLGMEITQEVLWKLFPSGKVTAYRGVTVTPKNCIWAEDGEQHEDNNRSKDFVNIDKWLTVISDSETTMFEDKDNKDVTQGELKLKVRPLSSWTLNCRWAQELLERRGVGKPECPQKHYVIKKELPINRIVAFSPLSLLMSEPEFELVLESKDGIELISKDNMIELHRNVCADQD